MNTFDPDLEEGAQSEGIILESIEYAGEYRRIGWLRVSHDICGINEISRFNKLEADKFLSYHEGSEYTYTLVIRAP